MKREDAKKMFSYTYRYTQSQLDNKVDEIYNDFESRKCSSCKKYNSCSYIRNIVGLSSKDELKDWGCVEWEKFVLSTHFNLVEAYSEKAL